MPERPSPNAPGHEPGAFGMPLLVVMDVDSTFIRQEVIEMLAAHAGREAEVAAVTEAAMRGELDFAESLRRRCRALAGLPTSVFDEVRSRVELTDGAAELVARLHEAGHVVALVSGGFEEVVRPLAAEHGITRVIANRLAVREGTLTGDVDGEIVDRAGKAVALRRFAEAAGIPMSRTVAVGDGANDLDMLAAAGLGIGFGGKPVVRENADVVIDTGCLLDVWDLLPH